jgi:NADH:ubiquinone oxidoreductase subunit 2 (subunit N)
VGLYYYLNVLKYVYLYRTDDQDEENHQIQVARPVVLALIILVIGILLLGTLFGPWFGLASKAAISLF